jgi:hypothetical protein
MEKKFVNEEVAQRAAKIQIEFVNKNIKAFCIHASDVDKKALNDFSNMLVKLSKFSPNQLSYIEGLYEKTMRGLGFQSVPVKHDFKRKF